MRNILMIVARRQQLLSTTGLFIALFSVRYASSTPCTYAWVESPSNPVIAYQQSVPNHIWNDPVVIRDGSILKMFLSGGTGTGPVRIYSAASPDGITWTIDIIPRLSPGPRGSWDDGKTETPSVVKVGSTYHLYYTGCRASACERGAYDIGHATSADGRTWTKDPANPVLARAGEVTEWGGVTVAEPTAIHDPEANRFSVYFTAQRCHQARCTGNAPVVESAIMRATSVDGSSMTVNPSRPVLTQSAHYSQSAGYYGYSTPAIYRSRDSAFHLYYDVAKYLGPKDVFRQVAIARATSLDGISFTETQRDILVNGQRNWYGHEVRSPSPLEDGGAVYVWFAGNSGVNPADASFSAGIGLTVYACR